MSENDSTIKSPFRQGPSRMPARLTHELKESEPDNCEWGLSGGMPPDYDPRERSVRDRGPELSGAPVGHSPKANAMRRSSEQQSAQNESALRVWVAEQFFLTVLPPGGPMPSVSPAGCSSKVKARRRPSRVRNARKTVRWTVFSGERAASPGALCGAAATAKRHCGPKAPQGRQAKPPWGSQGGR